MMAVHPNSSCLCPLLCSSFEKMGPLQMKFSPSPLLHHADILAIVEHRTVVGTLPFSAVTQ
jgi:hypothetical protein